MANFLRRFFTSKPEVTEEDEEDRAEKERQAEEAKKKKKRPYQGYFGEAKKKGQMLEEIDE